MILDHPVVGAQRRLAQLTLDGRKQTDELALGHEVARAGSHGLDRNFFAIPPEQIADIKVLQTVVGGRVVYRSDQL